MREDDKDNKDTLNEEQMQDRNKVLKQNKKKRSCDVNTMAIEDLEDVLSQIENSERDYNEFTDENVKIEEAINNFNED